MIRRFLVVLAAFFVSLSFFVTSVQAADFVVPQYDGLVNDLANVIDQQNEEELEERLMSFANQEDGAEIAVVTLPSAKEGNLDLPIEEVANQIFSEWQIGKISKDNGVLLLVIMEPKGIRIETGYGTETVITDATAGRIIRQDIAPAFQGDDFAGGIEAGVNTLITYLEDPTQIPDNPLADAGPMWGFAGTVGVYLIIIFFVTFISYGVAFLGRSKSWWPGGLIGLILGFLIGSLTGGIFFGLVGLLLDYVLSKNYKKWKLEKRTTSWRNTMGGFTPASGGRSKSGGFSFGGGRSGGGGASGSW